MTSRCRPPQPADLPRYLQCCCCCCCCHSVDYNIQYRRACHLCCTGDQSGNHVDSDAERTVLRPRTTMTGAPGHVTTATFTCIYMSTISRKSCSSVAVMSRLRELVSTRPRGLCVDVTSQNCRLRDLLAAGEIKTDDR